MIEQETLKPGTGVRGFYRGASASESSSLAHAL